MLKISTLCGLLMSIAMLSACSTGSSANGSNDEGNKENAAKINTHLGLAYLQQGDVQRAKQKLLVALDEGPNVPESWYSMAYFMEKTGNVAKAKKYYLKAVALAPTRGDTLNNYGTFLCRHGDYPGAIKQFMTALEDPSYLNSSSAYTNAGLCALKIPDTKLALDYFGHAQAEDPTSPSPYIELAELNYQQGDYALARKQLHQYLQLVSPDVRSYELEKKIDAKVGDV